MLTLTLPERTWAHAIPVGPKLLILVASTAALYPVESPIALAGCFAAAVLACVSLGRAAMRQGFRMLVPISLFAALAFAYHAAIRQPEAGAAVALKLLTLVGLANLVTMTSRLDDLVALVTDLTKPLRRIGLNPAAVALAFALVLRFMPVLARKGRDMGDAWKCRSTRRVSWAILIPLCLAALDDAESVADALRARGGVGQRRV